MPNINNERIAYTAPRWAWLAIILFLKQADRPVARKCLKLLKPAIPDTTIPPPTCSSCGSDNVTADASAQWHNNRWVLASVQDSVYCENCGDGPARIQDSQSL